MRLIHLLLISSFVWIFYCMYVYILPVYLFEKIFCYSYRRKIIDIQQFPYISVVRSSILEASQQ